MQQYVIGFICLSIGIYLFRDPAKQKRKVVGHYALGISINNTRLYKIFGLIGAIVAYFIYEAYIESFIPSDFPIPKNLLAAIIAIIGAFIVRSWMQVTEDIISVSGPTFLFIFSYDYLKFERNIDLLDYIAKLPAIPNITNDTLEFIMLLIIIIISYMFRRILRRTMPIILAGIFSGLLIANGSNILIKGTLPSSRQELELQASAILTIISITYQIYFNRKQRKNAEIINEEPISTIPTNIKINCPACLEYTNHEIINRKETPDGIDVLIQCKGKNVYDTICDNYQTVREENTQSLL
ncbi:MAG: hypothetical protein ACJZ4F_01825 [Candidatus Thalassarchaeaceae archaeon]|tara:strand:- start:15861 stop:16751 length:891 start_codon:yes stop_codon:yes gene_type:complete